MFSGYGLLVFLVRYFLAVCSLMSMPRVDHLYYSLKIKSTRGINSADNEQNPLSLCVHSDPASRAVFASDSLPRKIREGLIGIFFSCGPLNVTCAVYSFRIAPGTPFFGIENNVLNFPFPRGRESSLSHLNPCIPRHIPLVSPKSYLWGRPMINFASTFLFSCDIMS